MAPRNANQPGSESFDRSAAEDVVFGNLELEQELGGNTDDNDNELDLDDDQELEFDDDQDDDDPFNPAQLEQDDDGEPLRDLRVSHTRDQQREPKKEKQPLPRRSEVKPDGKGNLVNAKGEIVARGGVQSRLYQKAERVGRQLRDAQAQNTDLTNRMNQLAGIARKLHTQVEAYKTTENKIKEFGLTPQKQLAAMQLFNELESNPQQAIKRILTRAAANGINVAELGGNGGSLDAKALADMVKDQVGKLIDPLKQRSDAQEAEKQQTEQQRRELEAVQDDTNRFFQRNPRAVKYLPLFKKALAHPRYQGYTLGEIWSRIVENLAANGNGRQRSRTPNGQGRSIPRGRGAAPGGNSTVADPNLSYGDILKDVIKEHGVPERV